MFVYALRASIKTSWFLKCYAFTMDRLRVTLRPSTPIIKCRIQGCDEPATKHLIELDKESKEGLATDFCEEHFLMHIRDNPNTEIVE